MLAGGEGGGGGIIREFGRDRYTLLYLKWITNQGPSACHMELCSMLCGSLGGGREFGGEWIQVHVWLSPFTVHLKLSQH